MGSRYGKTTPILLAAIAVVIVLALLAFALLSRSSGPSEEGTVLVPEGAAVRALIHAQPVSRTGAAAVEPAAAASAAALLSDSDLKARFHSENAALVRARVIVAQSDPQVAALIADSEEKERALRAGLEAHPDIVKLAEQRVATAAALADVTMRIQALSNHLHRHSKPGAAATVSPVQGCEFCEKDFDAFVAGDKAVVTAYQEELSSLDARRLNLSKTLRKQTLNRKAIEARLRASDPEISQLAQAADGAAQAGKDGLAANPAVAAPASWLVALKAERAKRRAAIIDADVARASGRSGRNDQVKPAQTNGSPSISGK